MFRVSAEDQHSGIPVQVLRIPQQVLQMAHRPRPAASPVSSRFLKLDPDILSLVYVYMHVSVSPVYVYTRTYPGTT